MDCCLINSVYLPTEIEYKILNYLNFETLKKVELVNKIWLEKINAAPYLVDKEREFIKKAVPYLQLFPKNLIDALGGVKSIYKLPILEKSKPRFGAKFESFLPQDMTDPIMRGFGNCDILKQTKYAFIAFKILIKDSCNWQKDQNYFSSPEKILMLKFNEEGCVSVVFHSQDIASTTGLGSPEERFKEIEVLAKKRVLVSKEGYWFPNSRGDQGEKMTFVLVEKKTKDESCCIS